MVHITSRITTRGNLGNFDRQFQYFALEMGDFVNNAIKAAVEPYSTLHGRIDAMEARVNDRLASMQMPDLARFVAELAKVRADTTELQQKLTSFIPPSEIVETDEEEPLLSFYDLLTKEKKVVSGDAQELTPKKGKKKRKRRDDDIMDEKIRQSKESYIIEEQRRKDMMAGASASMTHVVHEQPDGTTFAATTEIPQSAPRADAVSMLETAGTPTAATGAISSPRPTPPDPCA